MTQPTNLFDSFDAIGNREDLIDIIYDVSPTDTPFMSSIARNSASATLHEWQTDSLAAASTSNAQIEGDDLTAAALSPTTRLTNNTQISNKVIAISGTQESVNKAGRDSEVNYQTVKAGLELRRDMEAISTGNQASVTGDSTTARKLRSLESWYTTNTSRGTNGANGSSTQAATDATTAGIRAFTESLLKTVIKSTYNSGGNPDMLMVGPFNKQVVSGFAGNATAMRDAEDMTLFASVDIYKSDFGEFKVVPNRFSRDRTAHLIDSDFWATSFLRGFQEQDLAKTGDSTKKFILSEYTLEARNEAASGVIADLTVS